MKKLLCILLILSLCACALSGCRRSEGTQEEAPDASAQSVIPDVTAVPEEGGHGEEEQSLSLMAMPTLEPVEPLSDGEAADGGDGYFDIDALINSRDDGEDAGLTAISGGAAPDGAQPAASVPGPVSAGVDTSTYQYSALTDTSLGFTFNYPSHWVNVPGVYTVCFREPAEDGKFPARVAITVKNLVHTPDETVMTEQMTAYMRVIHKQYDSKTFESGTPNMQDTFMGKQALSNTYLAFSGDTEVKGFVIGAAAGRTMCVFHFCASYDDYAAMESLMRYMLNSVKPAQSE